MPNQILSRQSLKYRIVIGVAAGFFAVTGSALAEGLSDQDYLYLATVQHVDHAAAVLNISPLERAKLHYLINDPQAAEDPAPRDKNVRNALDEFLAHQVWEKSHPGQLWDLQKR
jgi:hypothetical protein